MMTRQQQEPAMFGGWFQSRYHITPPTPTGDMQNDMDAVMPLARPAQSPAAPGGSAPQTLPNMDGETQPGWMLLAAGIVALLSGGLLLRRARV